tara:strand:- start:1029 stop:2636 length:1608 start_codon:yes stop_codon:yes gene_type:complete
MRGLKKLAILLPALLLSCSDYELNPKVDPPIVVEEPNITVYPAVLSFGHLDAGMGETRTELITITNIGNKPLNLSHIGMDTGDTTFSVTSPTSNLLQPNAQARVTVTYNPTTYETNFNQVVINSNDPDSSTVKVPLHGQASAPVIEIDPAFHDFGTTYIGCEAETTVGITNVGDSSLVINDIQYFVSYPPELSIEIDITHYGPFPWTMLPNERRLVTIYHEPWDLQEDSGFVEVHSSDPATPVAISNQEAFGDYYAWTSDFYEQEEIANADILFVIDNSCSMYSHQTNLKNNFASFIGVFAGSGVDYQIAFITTDNENFVDNKIVHSTDADPIGDVTAIIDGIGISGHGLERGLWESYEATQSGGNAGPNSAFLRNDSRLVIVYLSDERDGSTSYSSMTHGDYASHLLTLKPSADQLSVNAVAGDHPTGCSPPWAQHGAGYYEVVQQLGGTFMSICATDYGLQLDTLARDSILLSAFELSDVPIEDSIIVTVDGRVSTDWTYNATENAVYFDTTAIPGTEAEIIIDYAVLAECEP